MTSHIPCKLAPRSAHFLAMSRSPSCQNSTLAFPMGCLMHPACQHLVGSDVADGKQYCLGFRMLPIAALMAKQYCLGFRMLPIAALMAKQSCLGFKMLPTTVPMAKQCCLGFRMLPIAAPIAKQ